MEDYTWSGSFFRQFTLAHGKDSFSQEFRDCFERDLAIDLKAKTGLDVNGKAKGITFVVYRFNDYHVSLGAISYSTAGVEVLAYVYPAQIAWQSKSGRIYAPGDPDIDPDDIHFWFSELEVEAIRDRYFKQKPKLWFKTNHLRYALEIEHLVVEGIFFIISFDNPHPDYVLRTKAAIGEFVQTWNEKSERGAHRGGLIHSCACAKLKEDSAIAYFDMGSSSKNAMKQMLDMLDNLGYIVKIKITSFPEEDFDLEALLTGEPHP